MTSTHEKESFTIAGLFYGIAGFLAGIVGVPGLLLFSTSILAPVSPVQAASGQCVWEGGSGASGGYLYCEAEDCIGNGGLAQCSAGTAAPPPGVDESLVGEDKWVYGMCHEGPGSMPDDARWCEAGGGTWDAFANPPVCNDQDEGMLGLNSTSSDSLAESVTDAWIDIKFAACETSLATDTGWGQSVTSNFCFTGSPGETLGVLGLDFRQRTYTRGGTCEGTTTVTLRRDRSVVCPPGYTMRTAVSGPECFVPAECANTCVGNPVSVITGTKFHREDDYVIAADTGFEFSRFYKSTGYYHPPELAYLYILPGGMRNTDVWRHSYQQRLLIFPVNPEVLGVLQRPNGSLQVFDTAGKELTNRTSSGAELVEVTGVGWNLTRDDGAVERYDEYGFLQTITTLTGRVTSLTYFNGRITTITGPFGHTLTLAYDGLDRLSTVTLPDSGVITYGYDGANRLTSVTYPDSATKQYRYEDPEGAFLLTGIVDENAVDYASYGYDSDGRVIAESHAGGVEIYSFAYGTLGQPTSVTDPLGTTTSFGFDVAAGLYRPASYSQPCMACGAYSDTTYDASGNPATRTDYNGNQTTYTYDATRNLQLSRTEAAGTALARTITTQWHPTLRLPTQVTEPGLQTDLSYDVSGNLLSLTVTDTATSATRTWAYSYSASGQVLSIDGPLPGSADTTSITYHNCAFGNECGQPASVTNPAGHITGFLTYDGNGLPLTISDPNGTVATLSYDGRQRLTSTTVGTETTSIDYWPTGLIKKITSPDGSFAQYDYDDAQRLDEISDSDGNRIEYTLDGAGHVLAETIYDPLDVVVFSRTRSFDDFGRLEDEVGSASQTASYTYDLNGNVLSEEDPTGRVTSFAYDPLNRLATIEDPALSVSAFTYDASDRLLSVDDPRNLVTNYGYNGFGEQTLLASPDTGATVTTRDAAGNVDVSTDARNEAGDYSFDVLGRLTGIVYGDQTVAYDYDGGPFGAGQLTQVTDGSGSTDFSYDAQGRVVLREQTTGSVGLDVAYGYDISGRLTSLTTPSGQIIGFSYANGRVSGVTVNSQSVVSQVGYAPFGPTTGWLWANGATTTRSYDTDGQLVYLASAGESSTFSYYPDGRIQSRQDSDPVSVPLATGATTFSVSSASNHLNTATGLEPKSFYFDAAGNTLSDGTLSDGTLSYGYDDAGRLVQATVGATTTSYAHNGLGERVSKTDGQEMVRFAYDEAGHLIGEYDGSGALIQETVWFGDIPIATLRPDGQGGVDVFYVHTDHLNTPRKVTRPGDNAIVWRWDSDPFGQTEADEDPDGDTNLFTFNLRFPGQYFDQETGLHYNYFRDYDAVTGRYIQSDPIGLDGGLNTYLYASANPLRFTDPSGLQSTGSLECFKHPWCIELMYPSVSRETLARVAQAAAAGASLAALRDMCVTEAANPLDNLLKPMNAQLPLDVGGEEWGRRKGVGAAEGRRRAHRIKNSDPMHRPTDKYTVDPQTGDVFDPEGQVVGNLNEG